MNCEKIGKSNPIIKQIKSLYKKNVENSIIIEDLNSLELALKFNHTLNTFLYCDDIEYHPETKRIIDESLQLAKFKYKTSRNVFDTIALKNNSIGFIAIFEVKTYTLNEFKNKDFLLVCDRLEIPGNLGTIYRTVDSTNCEGIILCDSITKYNNPKLTQAARGTNMIVDTAISSYEETLNYLLQNDYEIFLGEPNLGKSYDEYDYKGKIALVVGNERFGINPDWYNHKHTKVHIPMEGNNNSLNVSVAASILLYEAYIKRKKITK